MVLSYILLGPSLLCVSFNGSIQTWTNNITGACPSWSMQVTQVQEGGKDMACAGTAEPATLLIPICPPLPSIAVFPCPIPSHPPCPCTRCTCFGRCNSTQQYTQEISGLKASRPATNTVTKWFLTLSQQCVLVEIVFLWHTGLDHQSKKYKK